MDAGDLLFRWWIVVVGGVKRDTDININTSGGDDDDDDDCRGKM